MDDPTATPDPDVEEPPVDTPPPAEPVEPAEPDPEADQPAAPGSPIAQAEYTRATQVAAAIRRELGLPKGATQTEVIAALHEARAVADDEGDGEDVEEDPQLTAERERRITAELRVTSAIYGETFTADALALLNAARTSDDLEELITMVAAFRDNHSAPASPAAPAAAEVPPAAPGAEAPIDLSEGDLAPRPAESTPAGRRESGAVAAIRGLFEQAGIASRPPRT